MSVDPAVLSLDNPVFRTYMLAASIMILKLMFQPWMTVVRMTKAGGGFRSPEDAKKSPLNPRPAAGQLEINEYVDRSRRINLNDLESIPGFLAAGFLLVLSQPPLLLDPDIDLDVCRVPGSPLRRLRHRATARCPRVLLDLGFALRHRNGRLRAGESLLAQRTLSRPGKPAGSIEQRQRLPPTIANIAPCGSTHWAIQLPPGT